MVYAFVGDLAESNRPINLLMNPIQVQVNSRFVVARRVESRDAGTRAKRSEVSEGFICFPGDCRAYFVLCVNHENLAQTLSVDINSSNCEEVMAHNEASRVDSTSYTG